MDKAYVSEFTIFMDKFLKEHPDAVAEQQRGWDFFWNQKIDPTAPDLTKEDYVPDYLYGFSWSAWRADLRNMKQHEEVCEVE